MKLPIIKTIVLIGTLLLQACINMQTVTEFSHESVKGIEKFEQIKLRYSDIYRLRMRRDYLENYDFDKRPLIPLDYYNAYFDSDSARIYQQADVNINLMYLVIKEYFQGLRELSNNELVNFDLNVDRLSNAISENPLIKVGTPQVQAYGQLARLMTRCSVDMYRRKKMGQYIEKAHPSLMLLTENMDQILSNMKGVLELEKMQVYISYQNLIIKEDAMSYTQKFRLAEDFISRREQIESQLLLLESYRAILAKIRTGHQELYMRRAKLDDKELFGILPAYIAEIQKLDVQFEKLNRAKQPVSH